MASRCLVVGSFTPVMRRHTGEIASRYLNRGIRLSGARIEGMPGTGVLAGVESVKIAQFGQFGRIALYIAHGAGRYVPHHAVGGREHARPGGYQGVIPLVFSA